MQPKSETAAPLATDWLELTDDDGNTVAFRPADVIVFSMRAMSCALSITVSRPGMLGQVNVRLTFAAPGAAEIVFANIRRHVCR